MKTFLSLFLLLLPTIVIAETETQGKRPLALIYKGEGSCEEDCSESLAAIAQKMGFETKYVGPQERDYAVFEGASVWLAKTAMEYFFERDFSNCKKSGIS
jgi:hypothetical protein